MVVSSKERIGMLRGPSVIVLTSFLMAAVTSVNAQEEDFGVEEIVVTATKRPEDLQSVPISVSVLTGDQIRTLGMQSTADIVAQIPNVEFTNTGPLPVFAIRGVQLLEIIALGNEPPVGMYFDDVYVGTLAGQSAQLFDLENVQVLRGPQGTLFGRNATGGLVNYISRKPTDEFEGYLNVRGGRFEQRIVEGAVGGPIADTVRARVAARYNEDNGFQRNLANPPGGRFGKSDSLSGRALIEFDLTENLQALVNVHGSRIRDTTQLYGHYGRLDPVTGDPCAAADIFAGNCVDRDGFGVSDPSPTKGHTDREDLVTDIDSYGANLTLTWQVGDVELVSVTSYDEFERVFEEDTDNTAAPRFLVTYGEDANQFTQELRLSGSSERLDWVVGGYYYEDERETEFRLPQLIDQLVPLLGPVIGTAGLRNRADVDTESWAVFGEASYNITSDVSITLGLRYTDEQKDLFMSDNPDDPLNPLIAIVEDRISNDNLSGKVGIKWQSSDNMMLYGSVARGFKSGAFNSRGGVYSTLYYQGFLPEVQVGPEKATSFEVGMKSTFAGGKVRLNGGLFYTDYQNVQVTAVDRSIPDIDLTNLVSAGDADIYGAEIEMTAKPTSNLMFTLGLGLLDTKLNSTTEINGIPLDGNSLPKAPKWSLNGIVRYDVPMSVLDGRLGVQTEYKLQAKEWMSPENIEEERQKAYQVVNLRLLWDSADGDYSASVFVENVFKEKYYSFIFSSFDKVTANWQRPLWWGASVTANF